MMNTSALMEAMERLQNATVRIAQADSTTQATVALASLGAALAISACAGNSTAEPDSSPRVALSLMPPAESSRIAEHSSGELSAAQVQGLQKEVAALRQTLDDGLVEPTEPDAAELVAEIQQLRAALADAEHASKAAWKARADDWKAFEAERATTKLALTEAAEIARRAKVASATPTVEATDRKDEANIGHQNMARVITLEEKQSPGGTANATVTVEQVNIAIRDILSPIPVVVQGVLSPRDGDGDGGGGELTLTQDCATTAECKFAEKAATSLNQLIVNDVVTQPPSRAKRRPRSWSRHKKGRWNEDNTHAGTSLGQQALEERQAETTV